MIDQEGYTCQEKMVARNRDYFMYVDVKEKDTLGSICVVLEIIADDITDEKEHPAMCIFFGYV